jgi:hypothetical protein
VEESLAINRDPGDKWGIAQNLERLAAVAVAQAQSERAARLFGAAEGLREAMGAPLPPADRAEHDRSVAAIRTALGEAGESEAGGRAPGSRRRGRRGILAPSPYQRYTTRGILPSGLAGR